MNVAKLTRRDFGKFAGALVATFTLTPLSALPQPAGSAAQPALPISLRTNRRLDGWIRIDEHGAITVFTGKAELGQGILTALAQIAADELDADLARVQMVSADTTRSPNEGYTYGSQSIEQSGAALRIAAAQARATLLQQASIRLGVPVGTLRTENGRVLAAGGRAVSYGDLVAGKRDLLDLEVTANVVPKRPADFRLVGKAIPRLDLPGKFTGEAAYVQDLRMPGMLFGRVVRPPRAGVRLLALDDARVRALPGVIAVVRDGNFLGVVAQREEQAIAARGALAAAAQWSDDGTALPDANALPEALHRWRSEDSIVASVGQEIAPPADARHFEATYSRPYLSQASIGPSCAVALLNDAHLTVWSHTQGAFPLRGDLATVLGMPVAAVDVVHTAGSGCYGHNGADDAALDAALLARQVPGRPVKLQWMRDDEFAWSPISPAMAIQVKAALSNDGRIVDWQYELWSNTHAARPGQKGGINLLAAWDLARPFSPTPPLHIPQPYGNGDRNAVAVYDLPRQRVVNHLLLDAPIRTSSLRTLGAYANVFAIESFIDELAAATGIDPVAFRRAHLSDPRALAVLDACARRAGWRAGARGDGHRGRGLAYSRYKNIQAYAAAVVEVEVDRERGIVKVTRVTMAADVGRVVNPDGTKSQIEGGIVQALSWSLKERVAFDRRKITTRAWADYPILRFDEVPPIDIELIDHPDEASLGAGEFSVGPAAAALANAIAHATGRRIRDLPITPDKLRGAFA
ncbi:molybdopterin-dependent oxidoreductase [Burkholderia sp. AU30280]|uniref:xanthine dehydrogenase family protein molybdopterin-binding subunit n=1 Tax=Burkholderia sp. AU30280 TaxID=2879628 RepID=UPI001CF1336C|nr:molybdopterin cofactor-binding domain-containing protein [Burkholderia sp. AU30280]MCA8275624.1 molybdopterin-dependent oxidoreductase [Burkholderia sp. AU30280]